MLDRVAAPRDPRPLALVKIKYVSMRGDRPRFNPGSALRKLGFAGEDLRHGAIGPWFTLSEVAAYVAEIEREVAARRAKKRAGKRLAPRLREVFSIGELLDEFRASKAYRTLAPATVRDYAKKLAALEGAYPELMRAPASDFSKSAAIALHEELWEARGHAMANGMLAVLRAAFSQAVARGRGGLVINPCEKLRLPGLAPRLRVASPQEIQALMQAADAIEIGIGDAILLALYTGQRQGDVLALAEEGSEGGRIRLRQSKTGARVSVRIIPPLASRLATVRERSALAGRIARTIVQTASGSPYKADHFRHRFAAVRETAIAACPSLEGFRFLDLRDTAVTWLHRAGCDVPEIASVTGHSLETVHRVLKHYLAIDEATNDRAMGKLASWLEGQ
jgi:integrase